MTTTHFLVILCHYYPGTLMQNKTLHSLIFVRSFLLLSLTVAYLGSGNQALANTDTDGDGILDVDDLDATLKGNLKIQISKDEIF